MNQHAEITELLGDLMGRCRQPRSDSESDIDEHDTRHSESTQEIVKPVAQENQIGKWLLTIGGRGVAK